MNYFNFNWKLISIFLIFFIGVLFLGNVNAETVKIKVYSIASGDVDFVYCFDSELDQTYDEYDLRLNLPSPYDNKYCYFENVVKSSKTSLTLPSNISNTYIKEAEINDEFNKNKGVFTPLEEVSGTSKLGSYDVKWYKGIYDTYGVITQNNLDVLALNVDLYPKYAVEYIDKSVLPRGVKYKVSVLEGLAYNIYDSLGNFLGIYYISGIDVFKPASNTVKELPIYFGIDSIDPNSIDPNYEEINPLDAMDPFNKTVDDKQSLDVISNVTELILKTQVKANLNTNSLFVEYENKKYRVFGSGDLEYIDESFSELRMRDLYANYVGAIYNVGYFKNGKYYVSNIEGLKTDYPNLYDLVNALKIRFGDSTFDASIVDEDVLEITQSKDSVIEQYIPEDITRGKYFGTNKFECDYVTNQDNFYVFDYDLITRGVGSEGSISFSLEASKYVTINLKGDKSVLFNGVAKCNLKDVGKIYFIDGYYFNYKSDNEILVYKSKIDNVCRAEKLKLVKDKESKIIYCIDPNCIWINTRKEDLIKSSEIDGFENYACYTNVLEQSISRTTKILLPIASKIYVWSEIENKYVSEEKFNVLNVLDSGKLIPIIYRTSSIVNYDKAKEYNLISTDADNFWKILEAEKSNYVNYFWPNKRCDDKKPNSKTYLAPNENNIGLDYESCGQIKGLFAQNKISKEMRAILKEDYPNSENYGIYFITKVMENSNIAKANSDLIGKQIILVANHGLLFDDVYYYILKPKSDLETKQEIVLTPIEKISDMEKEEFCNSKNKYYKIPKINLSYNSETINCSAYGSKGHFCDSEQLVKYVEKNNFKPYTQENINTIISELDYINLKIGAKTTKYFAKDTIPLFLSEYKISKDMNLELFSEDLFVVLDGVCPGQFSNKAGYLENINKCYIPYETAKTLELKGYNSNWEFLFNYDNNVLNISKEVIFNLLIALGENPNDYGLDMVYLKPDTYNYSGKLLETTDAISELNLTIYENENTNKKLDKLLLPNIYLLTVTKNESRLILGTINYFKKYSLSDTFWENIGKDNAMYYLAFNPSYTIKNDLANIPIKVFSTKPTLDFITSSNPIYDFKFNMYPNKLNIYFSGTKFVFELPENTNQNEFFLENILPGLNKKEIYCYIVGGNSPAVISGTKYDNDELLTFVDNKAKVIAAKEKETETENEKDTEKEIVIKAPETIVTNQLLDLEELINYTKYNRALTYLSVDPKKVVNDSYMEINFSSEFRGNRFALSFFLKQNINSYLKTDKFVNLYYSLSQEKKNNLKANLEYLKEDKLLEHFKSLDNSYADTKQDTDAKDLDKGVEASDLVTKSSDMPSTLTSDQLISLKHCGITGEELFGNKARCKSCVYFKFNNKFFKYNKGKLEPLAPGTNLNDKSGFEKCDSSEIAVILNKNSNVQYVVE